MMNYQRSSCMSRTMIVIMFRCLSNSGATASDTLRILNTPSLDYIIVMAL